MIDTALQLKKKLINDISIIIIIMQNNINIQVKITIIFYIPTQQFYIPTQTRIPMLES